MRSYLGLLDGDDVAELPSLHVDALDANPVHAGLDFRVQYLLDPLLGDFRIDHAVIDLRGFACGLVFLDAIDQLPTGRVRQCAHVLAQFLGLTAVAGEGRRRLVVEGKAFL